jgi:hypothetical protein
MISIDLSGITIELDEHVVHPACPAIGMGGPWEYSSPAEGAEVEYTSARVIRNGRVREVNPEGIIEALERRGLL